MAFKPNYNQQRAERDRAKDQKKQEKLQRRQQESDRRKAGLPPLDEAADTPADSDSPAGAADPA